MTCKNNIDIIDIGSLETGPTYTFQRDKVGKSYIEHVLTSKSLYPNMKSCNVVDGCLGNTSHHQEIAVSIECGWYIKYTTPIHDNYYFRQPRNCNAIIAIGRKRQNNC